MKITKKTKEVLLQLASKYNACEGFKRELELAETVDDLALTIKDFKNDIARNIHAEVPVNHKKVIQYLNNHSFRRSDEMEIIKAMKTRAIFFDEGVKNDIYYKLFSEMHPHLTIADVEELYDKVMKRKKESCDEQLQGTAEASYEAMRQSIISRQEDILGLNPFAAHYANLYGNKHS